MEGYIGRLPSADRGPGDPGDGEWDWVFVSNKLAATLASAEDLARCSGGAESFGAESGAVFETGFAEGEGGGISTTFGRADEEDPVLACLLPRVKVGCRSGRHSSQ